jgi:hypothetical protein
MGTALVHAALRGLSNKFWIIGAVTVAVCAALAAHAAGQVIEASYLTDAARGVQVTPVVPTPTPPVGSPVPRDPSLLVERNMFCSDCVAVGAAQPDLGTGVPASTLALILVATSLGDQPWATLRDPHSGAQGAYGVGDRIPHVGPVEHVAGTWVDVRNDAAGRIERIQLLGRTPDGPAATVAAAAATPAQPFADRVRKIDDHTYEVDRQLVRDLVGGGKVEGVRVMPLVKANKVLGIKVVQARPSSIAAAIGLKSGDLIEAVDGAKIESAQQLIDMLARLDDISSVRLDGTRKGGALELDLRLR